MEQKSAHGTSYIAQPSDGASSVEITAIRLHYRIESDTIEIEVQTNDGRSSIPIELFVSGSNNHVDLHCIPLLIRNQMGAVHSQNFPLVKKRRQRTQVATEHWLKYKHG